MKRIIPLLLVILLLCGCTQAKSLADGSYTCEVTLEGGSGRASIQSPAALEVSGGSITAAIVWSSSSYDYMIVNGEKILPATLEGGSTFVIPVSALDKPMKVTADTLAMSTPHEIDYTLHFDAKSVAPKG